MELVNDLEDGSYTVSFLKSDAATAHHVEGCVWDVHHSELRRELLRVGDRLEAKLTAENEFVAWTPVELVKVLKDYTVSFLKSDDIVANARRGGHRMGRLRLGAPQARRAGDRSWDCKNERMVRPRGGRPRAAQGVASMYSLRRKGMGMQEEDWDVQT